MEEGIGNDRKRISRCCFSHVCGNFFFPSATRSLGGNKRTVLEKVRKLFDRLFGAKYAGVMLQRVRKTFENLSPRRRPKRP